MKQNTFISGLILYVLLSGAISCEKTNDELIGDIEGTYAGSFSSTTSLKSALKVNSEDNDGFAEITMMGDNEIRVHCYGDEIDTIIILDIYRHNDYVFVCEAGENFQQEYGHEKGNWHMEHMSGSQTDWMHHLEDDHEDGDDHYGNFDMGNRTFSYSFRMMENLTPYYLKFNGINE